MNGAHDIGGEHGFGPVVPEVDEPIFHAEWEERVLAMVLACGAVLGIGSTVYSIIDSPAAAERHNESRRRFVLTPAPVVGPDRSTGYGVSLAAEF